MNTLNKKFSQLVISSGLDALNDRPELLENMDDLHHELFNTDYFVLGYFEATQTLKECDFCPFDAISEVVEFDIELFGENTLKPEDINSEKVVNLLAYHYGQELLDEIVTAYNEQK